MVKRKIYRKTLGSSRTLIACGACEPQKWSIFIRKILLSLSLEGAESYNFEKNPSSNILENEAGI
ncbi:hypothetical protein [Lysinibacillus sp. NPDC093692]|uniref:hypothetical protein n=1 Tax=Lysinibacillus sp. NPDC093692 TaxID=3390578 RepID=UPI003D03070D